MRDKNLNKFIDIEAEFKKNTRHLQDKHGHTIDCKRGLWGVRAPTLAEAEREARHYFIQYYRDGEYTSGAMQALQEKVEDRSKE